MKVCATTISAVPRKDELFVLVDFNACVGYDHSLCPKVLGHHSVGNENFNGSRLLQICMCSASFRHHNLTLPAVQEERDTLDAPRLKTLAHAGLHHPTST